MTDHDVPTFPDRYDRAVVMFRTSPTDTTPLAPYGPGRILEADGRVTFDPDPLDESGMKPLGVTVPLEDVVRIDRLVLRPDIAVEEVSP